MAYIWTENEKKCCLDLAQKGYSAEEISKVIKGKTIAAIYSFCARQNFKIQYNTHKENIDFEMFKKLMSHKPKEI